MDTTPLPPFTPHRIRLVGHRDLGIIPARYVGCWLELENGTRHGPCAVFSAEPVAEAKASRGALVWVQPTEPGSWHYLKVDGRQHATYGANRNQCIKWTPSGYGIVYDIPSPDLPEAIAQITTWAREDGYEVPPWPGEPAATVAPQPAPKYRTVYNPNDIRRGDRHIFTDGTSGTALGVIEGWIAYTDRLPVVQCCKRIVRVQPVDQNIPF